MAEIRVAVPEHGLRHDLRAVNIVWRRELIRFCTDDSGGDHLADPAVPVPVRVGTGLVTGRVRHATGVGLQDLHLPGRAGDVGPFHGRCSRQARSCGTGSRVLARDARGPCQPRGLVIGKCLGGATIATFQGLVFLALAGFAHVPYNPAAVGRRWSGELLLLSFTLTAFGLMMAGQDKAVPVVHGPHSDAGDAAVLPLGSALPPRTGCPPG